MAVTTMAQDIFEGAQLRMGYILSLIDPNRTDPTSPIRPVNLRDSVTACLQLHSYLTEACELAWKSAFGHEEEGYNGTGTVCVLTFDATLRAFRAVERAVATATQNGELPGGDSHFEEVIARLRSAITELGRTLEEFRERWPWVNDSRLSESLAASARGERGKTTKDAFRAVRSRIQGQSA